MRLTQGEIANFARGAGFPESALAIAVAVAMAESSGRTDAYNGIAPDASYGLWQINMIGNLGPARRAAWGLSSNEQLFDPATNARAAYAVSNGGSNWRPWATYTNGSYRRFLAGVPSGGGMPVDPGPFRSEPGHLRVQRRRHGAADLFDGRNTGPVRLQPGW